MALSARYNSIEDLEDAKLEEYYKTRDSLEVALSMSCSVFDFSLSQKDVTIQNVASELSKKTLYIEYIKYHPILDNNTVTNYLGYSLDNTGSISIVDLGDANAIDRYILQARKKMQESRFQVYSKKSIFLEKELKEITKVLYEKLVKPFKKQLKGKQKLLIAPDSDLNLIPFEIFVNKKNQYLIENYEISYLSSGRDLLRKYDEFEESKGLIVVASPDFNSKNSFQKYILSKKFRKDLILSFPL